LLAGGTDRFDRVSRAPAARRAQSLTIDHLGVNDQNPGDVGADAAHGHPRALAQAGSLAGGVGLAVKA
jgi:hypothetical protein